MKVKLIVPPLIEQQKIAAILSTVDEKIDAIDTEINAIQKLKKGLMQQLLTRGIGYTEFKEIEQGTAPRNWEIFKLKDLCELITKGTTPTSLGFKFTDSGINFIKVEAISPYGGFLPTKFAHISHETDEALKRSSIRESDILYSIAGALGRVAIVKKEILPANINQALALIRIKKKLRSKIILQYLSNFLKSDFLIHHINKINVKTAQANLSLNDVGNFFILLPPLPEQQKIADILSTVDEKLDVLREKKETYQTLKKGLMQQLLTGTIRVTGTQSNPGD